MSQSLVVLGALIRQQRQAAGLTVRQLASRARVALGTVSHIENGRHRPHPEILSRILTVLAIDDGLLEMIWGLHAMTERPRYPGASASEILATIQRLSVARHRAWLQHDAATANELEAELDRLWTAYRVARHRESRVRLGEGAIARLLSPARESDDGEETA